MNIEVYVDREKPGYTYRRPLPVENHIVDPLTHPHEVANFLLHHKFRSDVVSVLMDEYQQMWEEEQRAKFEYVVRFEIIKGDVGSDGLVAHNIVFRDNGASSIGNIAVVHLSERLKEPDWQHNIMRIYLSEIREFVEDQLKLEIVKTVVK